MPTYPHGKITPEKILSGEIDLTRLNSIDKRKMMAAMMLTDQQKEWAMHYVEHYDRTRAVRETAGYSKKPTHVTRCAQANERSIRVRAYVKILEADLAARVDLVPEELLKVLLNVAMANMDDYCKWNNKSITLTDSATLTREQKAMVQEVSYSETPRGSVTKVKLFPKIPAIVTLLGIIQELSKKVPEEDRRKGKVRIGNFNVILAEGGLDNPKVRKSLETVYETLSGTQMALPKALMQKADSLLEKSKPNKSKPKTAEGD